MSTTVIVLISVIVIVTLASIKGWPSPLHDDETTWP
jgi:hypothetical protein